LIPNVEWLASEVIKQTQQVKLKIVEVLAELDPRSLDASAELDHANYHVHSRDLFAIVEREPNTQVIDLDFLKKYASSGRLISRDMV